VISLPPAPAWLTPIKGAVRSNAGHWTVQPNKNRKADRFSRLWIARQHVVLMLQPAPGQPVMNQLQWISEQGTEDDIIHEDLTQSND
jgi:hypothetical protein